MNTWRDIGKPEWLHNRTDPPQSDIIANCNIYQRILIVMRYVRNYGFRFGDVWRQMEKTRSVKWAG